MTKQYWKYKSDIKQTRTANKTSGTKLSLVHRHIDKLLWFDLFASESVVLKQ